MFRPWARRLGLGTAQLGLPYGIANRSGRVTDDEAAIILSYAAATGIELVDTARGYGRSEEVLGLQLPRPHPFRIVSKLGAVGSRRSAREAVEADLSTSLTLLGEAALHGLLVHHVDDLLGPIGDALFEAMAAVKTAGLVRSIGVSVYTGEQIDRILDRYEPDIVQVPINVFDRRLLSGGQLDALKARGIEIHARSVFLQGLLLMAPRDVPPQLRVAIPSLDAFAMRAEALGRSRLDLALSFVLGLPQIDTVICGVDTVNQLSDILAVPGETRDMADLSDLAVHDLRITDPSRWDPR